MGKFFQELAKSVDRIPFGSSKEAVQLYKTGVLIINGLVSEGGAKEEDMTNVDVSASELAGAFFISMLCRNDTVSLPSFYNPVSRIMGVLEDYEVLVTGSNGQKSFSKKNFLHLIEELSVFPLHEEYSVITGKTTLFVGKDDIMNAYASKLSLIEDKFRGKVHPFSYITFREFLDDFDEKLQNAIIYKFISRINDILKARQIPLSEIESALDAPPCFIEEFDRIASVGNNAEFMETAFVQAADMLSVGISKGLSVGSKQISDIYPEPIDFTLQPDIAKQAVYYFMGIPVFHREVNLTKKNLSITLLMDDLDAFPIEILSSICYTLNHYAFKYPTFMTNSSVIFAAVLNEENVEVMEQDAFRWAQIAKDAGFKDVVYCLFNEGEDGTMVGHVNTAIPLTDVSQEYPHR